MCHIARRAGDLALFLAGIAAPISVSWAQPKGQVGNIAYQVMASPNALDANHFSMTATVLGDRVGAIPLMTAIFQGSCSEVLTVTIMPIGIPQLKLEALRTSGSIRDLPMQELLQVTGRVLADRCSRMQVLRAKMEHLRYEGTLTRAGGWVLQDGFVPTEFDANASVELNMEDFFKGSLRVLHRGTCETEPKLLIEPLQSLGRSRDDGLLYDYASLATDAAAKYAQQCRMVQRFSFALEVMPENRFCAQAGDCFMEVKRVEGKWTAGFEQFKGRKNENPIADFHDMAEVLAAGSFDVLKDYQVMFGFFVWSYFDSYSSTCRAHIRQPVGRVTRYTTVKRDGNGNVISESNTEASPIMVEKAHAWAYDAHEGGARAYLLRSVMRSSATGVRDGFNAGMQAVSNVAAFGGQMKALLDGRCSDDRVLTMQHNMLSYAGGKEPMTGKYSTEKKPISEYKYVALSAPEFTKAYRTERAERFRAAAAPKAPDGAPSPLPGQGSTTPAQPANARNMGEIQRQYVEAVYKLEQDYRAQMQGAGVFQRLKLEVELKQKKQALDREFRENIKQAQRP